MTVLRITADFYVADEDEYVRLMDGLMALGMEGILEEEEIDDKEDE